MADNIQLNTGLGGDVLAADEISGAKYQRVKLIHGADGVNDGDAANTNPFPVKINSEYVYSNYQATLANSAEIDSDWIDMGAVDKYQLEGLSDTLGMTLVITSSNTNGGGEADVQTTSQIDEVTFNLFNVIARQRYMRFQWQNNTGGTVNDACLSIKVTYGSSDKLSVFPLGANPTTFSQAALVQSVIRGADVKNPTNYIDVNVSSLGALLTADFLTEVVLGNVIGASFRRKFGRNNDVDTGDEDIWHGGGDYTGFNATANENIEVLSADVNDQGSTISSGTATGGSSITIVDSGANFVGDGVAVGDVVVNDTEACHGVVTTVAATTLTVDHWTDAKSPYNSYTAESGDTYRVVNANDTGAALVKLFNLLDEDYVPQTDRYVVLNGTTGVTVTGSYMRCDTARVIHAGSSKHNEGIITVRQASTTANVFAQIPATKNATQIAATTIPANTVGLLVEYSSQMGRASGAAGIVTGKQL